MINFNDYQIAYKNYSLKELKASFRLFSLMRYQRFVDFLSKLGLVALRLRLPFTKYFIRKTIFNQFVGGRSLQEVKKTIKKLANANILTILDIGIEGSEKEEDYLRLLEESKIAIQFAKEEDFVPVITAKISGLGSNRLLERYGTSAYSKQDEQEFDLVKKRINDICALAANNNTAIFIDAEESWIQRGIDDISNELMQAYNHERVVVYKTYQLYRKDKLQELKLDMENAKQEGYLLGAKIVRGAYMEKENEKAAEMGVESVIHDNKQNCDNDYNAAIKYCLEHYKMVSLCTATHNQKSIEYQLDLMDQFNIPKNHSHINFCQLLGMKDNLSYNLAHHNYTSSKYVPYGSIEDVFPYLIRRSQENSSIQSEVERELSSLREEISRRKTTM